MLVTTCAFSPFSHNGFRKAFPKGCRNPCLFCTGLSSLPNGKIVDWFKFKAFADMLNVAKIMILPSDIRGNIVGNGQNAGYKYFLLLLPQCFQTTSSIAVENIVRKGETACSKQFLHFSQCLLPYMVYLYFILNAL